MNDSSLVRPLRCSAGILPADRAGFQRCSAGILPADRAGILPALVAAGAILATLLTVSGCGRKGDPLPPQIRRADATRDLTVFQEGPEAVLSWSYPSMTSAGGPLPDLDAVEVWRAPIPLGQEPLGNTAEDRAMRNRLLEVQGERLALLGQAKLDEATRGPKLVQTRRAPSCRPMAPSTSRSPPPSSGMVRPSTMPCRWPRSPALPLPW